METLTAERIAHLLGGPHQAVLAVGREAKGPVAVPMSYLYTEDRFVIVTSPRSLHGRLIRAGGRATMTIHGESGTGAGPIHQWYVTAEGTARFTAEDPVPFVVRIFAKDRGRDHAARWAEARPPQGMQVAELIPDRIAGYESYASLE